MSRNLLAAYKNGNYRVLLYDDGTKIRFNNLDNLTPDFAESMDISITTICDNGCEFCYLNCNMNGKHADLNQPFFNTLHPGTEIALNGNNLSHPELINFLIRMNARNIICNLTVNQVHFNKYFNFLYDLINRNLIKGLGVSLTDSTDSELYNNLSKIPNAVVHTIDGLLTKNDIENLSNHNIKLLILGYKILGRGDQYYNLHKTEIENNIEYLANNIMTFKNNFNVISFDNLAIEHLMLKEKINPEIWNQSYMGDEGTMTFYIDAVNKKFAVSSLDPVQYDYTDNMTVDDMFNFIRNKKGV